MATAIAKKNTTRRQPSKKRLPSSVVKKNAKKSTKKPAAKKMTFRLSPSKSLQLTFKVTTKKRKKSSKKNSHTVAMMMILVGLIGIGYVGWQLLLPPKLETVYASPTPIMLTPPAEKPRVTLPASDAVRLQIPAIDLNAPVIGVGQLEDGTLEVPNDSETVGQYSKAPTPGELGPAVLAGHVDMVKGPAVFWRLRELRPGQAIKVLRKNGSTAVFRITKVKNYNQNNFPTSEVYGNIDHAGLRLITCGGTFNHLKHRYNENTVVFAALINK